MDNDTTVSNNSEKDLQMLLSKASEVKQDNLLSIGSYCDFYYENEWHVAYLKNRIEDKLEIIFYCNEETKMLFVPKNQKISLFRLHSNQSKHISVLEEPYTLTELKEIKETLNKAEIRPFDICSSPYDVIQFYTGKIPEILDGLTLNVENISRESAEITMTGFDILLSVLKIISNVVSFTNEHRGMLITSLKNRELMLINKSYAYILSIEVLSQCLKRIISAEFRRNIYLRVSNTIEDKRRQLGLTSTYMGQDSIDRKIYYFLNDFYNSNKLVRAKSELIIQTPQMPFDLIDNLLHSFNLLKNYGTSLNNQEYFEKLFAYYKQRICSLNENELKELKKNIIIDYLRTICNICCSPNAAPIETEKLYYSFLYRCFMSQNLEKRIYALNSINCIINNMTFKSPIEEDQIYFKSYDLLIRFIQEKNIISILLGENAHEELIKRSIILLKFLAEKGQLSNENCENLWKNFTERHESISMQIETVICEIASALNEEKLKFLFEKIKSYQMINVKILHFIRKFTQGCYRTNRTIYILQNADFTQASHLYGLPLLWKYMQDSYEITDRLAGTSSIVKNNQLNIEECLVSIHALLIVSSISDSVVQKILYLCIENIKNHLSIMQSLRLIKKISKERKKQSRLYQEISETYDIFALIISDLDRYLKNSGNDLNSTYEGFYNHEKNINTRIGLIFFLVNFSQFFALNRDHVLELWTIFYLNSRTPQEQSILFNFFSKNIDSFDKETNYFFLNEVLNNEKRFNYSAISRQALSLFETVFIKNNINSNAIHNDGKNYRIKSNRIEGINTLWQILLYNSNENVQDRVCRLLCDFCLKLIDYRNEFATEYWTKFVDKLTEYLFEANKINNSIGINGLINLTIKIYNEVEDPGKIPSKDDVISIKNNCDLYTFVCPLRKNKQYHVKVERSEYLFDVRWRMAYYYDIEVNKLVFKSKTRSANMLNDFNQFNRIFNCKEIIQVTAGDNPLLTLINPKKLIEGKEQILKILFSLLHHSDAEYISKAWELIKCLPEKNFIQKQVKSLGENEENKTVDLKNLIDFNSLYVVTYSLQLINKYIISKEWLLNFISNKGHEIIMKVFLTIDITHFQKKGDVIFDCLNEVIPILKATLGNIKLGRGHIDNLCKKIIELIEAIVKVSIESDKNKEQIDYRSIEKVQREFLEDESDDEEENDPVDNNEKYHQVWKRQSCVIKNLLKFIQGTVIENDFENIFFAASDTQITKSRQFQELYTVDYIKLVNPYIKRELYLFISRVFDDEDANPGKVNKNQLSIKKIFFESIFTMDTLSFAKQNDDTGFYFNMLSSLLIKYIDISMIHIDLKQLCDLYLFSSIQNDQQIEGYMKLLHSLLIKAPGLIKYVADKYDCFEILLKKGVLSKCDNEPLNKPPPCCTSQRAQTSVYMVMNALCAYSPQLTEKVIKILNDYHHLGFWKTKHCINWKISLSNDKKAQYVGLKNLGCTCYLNSLLQLLFMIPQLRETLLHIDYQYPNDKYKTCIYQIKSIFASLKAYESQCYNAKDFCLNFDGEVLDIREQMDAEEFYSRLIDKLENNLKDLDEYKNLFKYFFGGKTVDELIFKDCIHKRENELYYNSIQLQVAGKKNINESLDSYIQGEMMEGNNAIYCEKCEKKMPALKRQTFKVFPRKLVLVLKRFEFDYDNMVKYKLNNYFEFPMVLNMAPYAQVPQDNEINYDLTGVIIHVGTCESGHYYSIINDGSKWYEFNDTYVKEFDIGEIANEAFGGFEDVYNRDNKKETVEKTMNAYILLYSKRECDPNESNFPAKIYSNEITPFSNIPPDIMDSINNDMLQYWVLKHISSNQYQRFIKELLKQANFFTEQNEHFICRNNNYGCHPDLHSKLPQRDIETLSLNLKLKERIEEATNEDVVISQEFNLFKFGCLFFFNVVIRCKDISQLPEFTDIIKAYINNNVDNAIWLIEEFTIKNTLKEFIVECPINQSKKISVGVIYCALLKLSQAKTNDNQIIYSFLKSVLQMTLNAYDMDFIWMILYRVFPLFKDAASSILNSIDFRGFCWDYYYSYPKTKTLTALQKDENEKKTLDNNTQNHHLLCDSSSVKVERLTSTEESIEKKNSERIQNSRNDRYLFNTMIYFINKEDFTKDKITLLLSNIRAKSSAIYFSNALIHFSKNDNMKTKFILETLLYYIKDNDIGKLEWPLLVCRRILFKGLYHFDEQQANDLITFFFKNLYIIFKEYLTVYSFIECICEFMIKCHTYHKERLQIAKNDITPMASAIYGFFKDNKYPPKFYPSNRVKMYKEDYIYPKNVSPNQIKMFEENYDIKRDDYRNKISQIYHSKHIIFTNLDEKIEKKSNYDSDEELTDFKFCVNDKVKYENFNCKVTSVLDEIIQIEYNKEEIEGKKKPKNEWIETDSKSLLVCELFARKNSKNKETLMQLDK